MVGTGKHVIVPTIQIARSWFLVKLGLFFAKPVAKCNVVNNQCAIEENAIRVEDLVSLTDSQVPTKRVVNETVGTFDGSTRLGNLKWQFVCNPATIFTSWSLIAFNISRICANLAISLFFPLSQPPV